MVHVVLTLGAEVDAGLLETRDYAGGDTITLVKGVCDDRISLNGWNCDGDAIPKIHWVLLVIAEQPQNEILDLKFVLSRKYLQFSAIGEGNNGVRSVCDGYKTSVRHVLVSSHYYHASSTHQPVNDVFYLLVSKLSLICSSFDDEKHTI